MLFLLQLILVLILISLLILVLLLVSLLVLLLLIRKCREVVWKCPPAMQEPQLPDPKKIHRRTRIPHFLTIGHDQRHSYVWVNCKILMQIQTGHASESCNFFTRTSVMWHARWSGSGVFLWGGVFFWDPEVVVPAWQADTSRPLPGTSCSARRYFLGMI